MMHNPQEPNAVATIVKPCSAVGGGIAWADISEDEDDDCFYEIGERKALGVVSAKNVNAPQFPESESDSSEIDSEEEMSASCSDSDGDDSEDDKYRTARQSGFAATEKGIEDQTRQLSKKEQRKLELDELNAAFAELGIDIPSPGPTSTPVMDLSSATAIAAKDDTSKATKKKRKNKKGGSKGDPGSVECSTQPDIDTSNRSTNSPKTNAEGADTAAVNPEQAVNLLKKIRHQPKPKKVGATVSAQATVLAEAKKRAEAKKPKPKKSERLPQYQK